MRSSQYRFALSIRLPAICLRVARFFPQPVPLHVLYRLDRGVDVRDAAAAHALAVTNRDIQFGVFNIATRSPFLEGDVRTLRHDAVAVLRERAPGIIDLFAQRCWKLPTNIDRVYVIARAQRSLGYRPDVHIQYIGFTQVAALVGHKVDAVMGYLNNEFVALQQAQVAVRSFPLSEVVHPLPLVSNGLSVLPSVLEKRPEDIRALIAATLRGFQDVSTPPEQAVEISKQYIPGLAILKVTIRLWQDGKSRQGYLDPETWKAMARFLLAYHILSRPEDPTTAYSNNYLPT